MNNTKNHATVNDGVLEINILIDDPKIVSHFAPIEAAGNDLATAIGDYLRLYIAILDAASPRQVELSVTQTVEGLGASIGSAMTDFERLLKETLGEHGQTAKAVDQFQRKLLDYADNESSPFQKLLAVRLTETVRQAMEKSQLTNDGIAQAVVASTEPKLDQKHKEILDSHKAVVESNNEVLATLRRVEADISSAKKVAEVIDSSPKKGAPYEDIAYDFLSKIASAASDLCEDTKNKSGEIGRKSGDFVVTHTVDGAAQFNVVYEAKSGPMTKTKWIEEADLALPNRNASVFVGLAKDKSGVPGKSAFTRLAENVVVLHFDPENAPTDMSILQVVYSFALSIGRSKLSHNRSGLAEAEVELRAAITDLKARYSQAKRVEENGKALKEFVQNHSKNLANILNLISSSDSSPSED